MATEDDNALVAVDAQAAVVKADHSRSRSHSPLLPMGRRCRRVASDSSQEGGYITSGNDLNSGSAMTSSEQEAGRVQHEEAVAFVAAARGDVRLLVLALERGAQPGLVALNSCVCRLPEDECVCLGYAPIHCAAQAGSASAVYALICAQADVSIPSGHIIFNTRANASSGECRAIEADGLTPLHVAAACGFQDVVELLLKCHADPHCSAARPHKTPLGLAELSHEGEIAELLRQARAERVAKLVAEPLSGVAGFLARQNGFIGSSPSVATNPRLEQLRLRVRAREQERDRQDCKTMHGLVWEHNGNGEHHR